MKTRIPRRFKLLLVAAALASTVAHAQSYPTRPIQLLIPFPAGAPVDALARAFGQAFSKHVGQNVVVMNREGGSTTVAWNALLNSPADGYNVLYGPVTALTVHPHWMKGLQYKPEQFTPVCQTFENIFVLAGAPNSPDTLDKVLAQAKAKPASLTYAHPGVSSSPHLAGAELFQRAGVQATDVPFRGEAAMIGQLRASEVDLGVVTTGFAISQALKPIVVFSEKRLPAFPQAPTAREAGYPVTPSGYGGLFVRADTPEPVIARIEESCRAAVADPAFKEMAQRLYQDAEFLGRSAFAARLNADAKSKADLLKTVKLER
ncbi:tripartite tricarboxylate transporter substrate binding protein [Ramlibacter sp. AW1]|uniref:Tripartite tricarboxylate transporter substrate binding protein n=1 Tax=Ramlibacter aurantiacus TaxID=2801330 RepID=A0A937D1U2_9BURK|nr:tripartite tricarboxylate transporter substrate binding protein [Ramlibacter aurantiacus]MBL0419120.1 tripartite tricarboxylate transporter substrate binding protein [Ramlibacter aurantiacus]